MNGKLMEAVMYETMAEMDDAQAGQYEGGTLFARLFDKTGKMLASERALARALRRSARRNRAKARALRCQA